MIDEVKYCKECHHSRDDHSSGILSDEDNLYYFPCYVKDCFCCNDYIEVDGDD
jgi:hypothetical protein